MNYRPEWGQKTYYTQLRLSPLGKDEAEELLTFLLGTDRGTTSRSPLQDVRAQSQFRSIQILRADGS